MADRTLLNGDARNGKVVVARTANGEISTICDSNGLKDELSIFNHNAKPPHRHHDFDIADPPDGGLRGWMVMISAFICNGVLFGIINTYSVIHSYLQEKLTEQHDAEASSKAALVGSLTIGTTFLLSPIAGVLTDKIGLRRTTLLGGLLSAGGMFISSYCTESIEALYLTYGVMFGLGAALAYTPTLAILGHYFKRYLGKVNGFVTAGSSVFTAILPAALDYLVKIHGLRITLLCMASILCFVILCAFVYKPLHPPPQPAARKPGRSELNTLMRKVINVDIWKRKRYVIWALSVPIALFGYFVPYVHMVKFMNTSFKDQNENLPVACIGISSGVGRLLFGVIADIPGVNRIFLQQMALLFIGVLTMLLPATDSYVLLIIFALVMGLFDGCFISLLGPIAYELCGPRGATQAIGFLLGLSSIPLTVGPPIAGKLFDVTGSYTIPFILAGIPPLVGATMMFMIRCIREESTVRDITEVDERNEPLTRSAWDAESKPEYPLTNGFKHLPIETRKASLATTGFNTSVKSGYSRIFSFPAMSDWTTSTTGLDMVLVTLGKTVSINPSPPQSDGSKRHSPHYFLVHALNSALATGTGRSSNNISGCGNHNAQHHCGNDNHHHQQQQQQSCSNYAANHHHPSSQPNRRRSTYRSEASLDRYSDGHGIQIFRRS